MMSVEDHGIAGGHTGEVAKAAGCSDSSGSNSSGDGEDEERSAHIDLLAEGELRLRVDRRVRDYWMKL